MPTVSVRLSEDLVRGLDAAASGAGGRSALLRRLIQESVGARIAEAPGGRRAPAAARLMVRLAAAEARHVDAEAAAMGRRRATWVAALVARHAQRRPRFSPGEERAVLAIQGEVHRIGVNVNQIARALNTAVLEGRVLELELGDLAALRRELRAHMAALREAFEGNLAYWDVE